MSRKTKNIIAIIMVIAVTAIALLGISNQKLKHTDDKNVIKIGAILPLTGNYAFAGESCRDGMLLAIEMFNKVHGKKVKVLCEDGKGTSKDSISSYNILSQQNVPIIFCAASVTANAIVNPALKQLTLLAIVSDSNITKKNSNVYNLTINSQQEIQAIFNFLSLKKTNQVAIIGEKDELGKEINEVARSLAPKFDISIVVNEEISGAETIVPAITRIMSYNPGAIFIGTAGSNAALIAKRLRELNYSGLICGLKSFNSPSIISQAGQAANGIHICMTSYDTEDGSLEAQNFKNDYISRFNKEPDIMAAYSFCIIDLALKAYVSANFDINMAKQILSETKNANSIFGPITCTDNRMFVFPVDVGFLYNGKVKKAGL